MDILNVLAYKRNGVTVLIDSHAHYDDERFDIDRDEILQKCIDKLLTVFGALCRSSAAAIMTALYSTG